MVDLLNLSLSNLDLVKQNIFIIWYTGVAHLNNNVNSLAYSLVHFHKDGGNETLTVVGIIRRSCVKNLLYYHAIPGSHLRGSGAWPHPNFVYSVSSDINQIHNVAPRTRLDPVSSYITSRFQVSSLSKIWPIAIL